MAVTMEIFQKASVVRLGSHHDRYLVADDNQESVSQDRDGSTRKARWTVEFSDSSSDHIRLKSCHDKYLTASNMPLIIGMRGKKVVQSLPRRLTSSVEWEPIREGVQVRFRTHYGQYLRANGKFPPWRGHITHDVSHRSVTQYWVLWDVEVLEHRQQEKALSSTSSPLSPPTDTPPWPSPSPDTPPWPSPIEFSLRGPKVSELESDEESPAAFEGRAITYEVVDENGDVNRRIGVRSLTFKGSGVEELMKTLKNEAGVNEEVIICSRNPLNGKLYPLRLHLPPNNAGMHVVLVPRSSKAAKDLVTQ